MLWNSFAELFLSDFLGIKLPDVSSSLQNLQMTQPHLLSEKPGIALKQIKYFTRHSCPRLILHDTSVSAVCNVLHLPDKSGFRFLYSPRIYDILKLRKAANTRVTDLICCLSPSAQQTGSLRCSATPVAKDKALFFLANRPTFLGLPRLAAGVQMCGNWVWNGLFEVGLPLCSSVIAILPIFPL